MMHESATPCWQCGASVPLARDLRVLQSTLAEVYKYSVDEGASTLLEYARFLNGNGNGNGNV